MSERTSTRELNKLSVSNPGRFRRMIVEGDPVFLKESIGERLKDLFEKHNKKVSDVISTSLLSKSYVYQVLQGEREPSREALIKMGIAAGCDLEEIQHLLMLAGEGVLYSKVRRDAAIMFCIGKDMNLYDTDAFLAEIGEKGLL